MSIAVKSVPLVTDGSGDAQATVRAGGIVLQRIDVEIGTMTTPDVDITEEDAGTVILSVNALAADATYYPTFEGTDSTGAAVTGSAVPVVVRDRIQIVVASGGASKSGRVVLTYER
jgi:hypothetical protein